MFKNLFIKSALQMYNVFASPKVLCDFCELGVQIIIPVCHNNTCERVRKKQNEEDTHTHASTEINEGIERKIRETRRR